MLKQGKSSPAAELRHATIMLYIHLPKIDLRLNKSTWKPIQSTLVLLRGMTPSRCADPDAGSRVPPLRTNEQEKSEHINEFSNLSMAMQRP